MPVQTKQTSARVSDARLVSRAGGPEKGPERREFRLLEVHRVSPFHRNPQRVDLLQPVSVPESRTSRPWLSRTLLRLLYLAMGAPLFVWVPQVLAEGGDQAAPVQRAQGATIGETAPTGSAATAGKASSTSKTTRAERRKRRAAEKRRAQAQATAADDADADANDVPGPENDAAVPSAKRSQGSSPGAGAPATAATHDATANNGARASGDDSDASTGESRARKTKPAEGAKATAHGPDAKESAVQSEADSDTPAGDAASRGRGRARFRSGFGILFGALILPGRGPIFGVQGHFGAQINDRFGIFWQPSLYGGFGFKDGRLTGTATSGQVVIADITFIDKIQVGAGGGVHAGFAGACGGGPCEGTRGWFPTFAARVAFLPSQQDPTTPGRRSFDLSLNSHTLFVLDTVVTQLTLGLGMEWY